MSFRLRPRRELVDTLTDYLEREYPE